MTTSKTEKKSHGGLTGLIYQTFVGKDTYYQTTITDDNGRSYRGSGSTQETSQKNAAREYNRRKK